MSIGGWKNRRGLRHEALLQEVKMHWFKVLLLVIMGLSVLLNLKNVARPTPSKNPQLTSAIAAVLGVLTFMGVLAYWP